MQVSLRQFSAHSQQVRLRPLTFAVSLLAVLAVFAISAPPTALAATATQSSGQIGATGRYTMTPVDDGFLRLDTVTGAVSLCQKADAGWRCQSVEDDQLALRQENEKLRAENKALRERALLAPDSGLAPGQKKKLELPSQEDVDKAIDFLDHVLRKFREMLRNQSPDNDGAEL